jgi:hypothetical protein
LHTEPLDEWGRPAYLDIDHLTGNTQQAMQLLLDTDHPMHYKARAAILEDILFDIINAKSTEDEVRGVQGATNFMRGTYHSLLYRDGHTCSTNDIKETTRFERLLRAMQAESPELVSAVIQQYEENKAGGFQDQWTSWEKLVAKGWGDGKVVQGLHDNGEAGT